MQPAPNQDFTLDDQTLTVSFELASKNRGWDNRFIRGKTRQWRNTGRRYAESANGMSLVKNG